MQDFLYYKLQLFSGVIFFILAFMLLTKQVRNSDVPSTYTFFSVFLILHSVTLFTELFLLFHNQSPLVSENITLYLSFLNGLALLALSAAIWQSIASLHPRLHRPTPTILFALAAVLVMFIVGKQAVHLQYKALCALWLLYTASLWHVHKRAALLHANSPFLLQSEVVLIALFFSAFSELLSKTSVIYAVYSLLSGALMVGVFIYHFQQRDKKLQAQSVGLLNAQIQEMHLKHLGEWSAALAHEVKTPLQSALLSTDIALRQLEPEHTAYPNLARTKRSIERATQVAEGVLNYARSTQMAKHNLDIAKSLNAVIHLLNFRLKSFTLQINIDEQLEVFGDDYLLQSVWTNLLSNAIDACDEQNKTLTIRAFAERDYVHVQIIDSGKLNTDSMAEMDKPFFTTKKASGGVGLGLSIVKTILHSHQGQLDFSRHAQGTCAHVMLPKVT